MPNNRKDQWYNPVNPEKFKPWIKVSQDVLDNSRRKNSKWCIGAVGTAYTIPGTTRIEVTAEIVRFNLHGYRYYFKTPFELAKNAIAFDDGEDIKPFRFRLTWQICPPMRVKNRQPTMRVEANGKVTKFKAKSKKRKYKIVSVKLQGEPYKKSPGLFIHNTSDRTRRWHGIKLAKGLIGE